MINSCQNKVYKKTRKRFYHSEFLKNFAYYYSYKEKLDILDIGCGNGDLSFYLSNKFINSKFYGIDYDKNNIKFANRKSKLLNKNKQLRFKNINFRKFKTKKKFDIIVAAGFLGYFDDFKNPLNKMIKLINPNKGKIYLFGDFNSSGIDKIIKLRNNNIKENNWMTGLSSYSTESIKRHLKKKKYHLKVKKFYLPKNIGNQNSDPMRSISRLLNGFGRIIFNKANLIFDFQTLIISKK